MREFIYICVSEWISFDVYSRCYVVGFQSEFYSSSVFNVYFISFTSC